MVKNPYTLEGYRDQIYTKQYVHVYRASPIESVSRIIMFTLEWLNVCLAWKCLHKLLSPASTSSSVVMNSRPVLNGRANSVRWHRCQPWCRLHDSWQDVNGGRWFCVAFDYPQALPWSDFWIFFSPIPCVRFVILIHLHHPSLKFSFPWMMLIALCKLH